MRAAAPPRTLADDAFKEGTAASVPASCGDEHNRANNQACGLFPNLSWGLCHEIRDGSAAAAGCPVAALVSFLAYTAPTLRGAARNSSRTEFFWGGIDVQTCATSWHGVQDLAAWGPGGAMMQRRRKKKKCGLVGIPRSCQRSRSKQPHMQRGRQQRGQKPQQLFAFCQSWPCCCGSSPRCGALHQQRLGVPFPAQQLMPVLSSQFHVLLNFAFMNTKTIFPISLSSIGRNIES